MIILLDTFWQRGQKMCEWIYEAAHFFRTYHMFVVVCCAAVCSAQAAVSQAVVILLFSKFCRCWTLRLTKCEVHSNQSDEKHDRFCVFVCIGKWNIVFGSEKQKKKKWQHFEIYRRGVERNNQTGESFFFPCVRSMCETWRKTRVWRRTHTPLGRMIH